MNIIVCCKVVLDPEVEPAKFKIDRINNKVTQSSNTPLVISPFDENAVEAALRLRDKLGGKVIILSLGNNLVRNVVKKPLAMGADELILLEDEAFVDGDSWSNAYALAEAIKKIGDFGMILCGRQAADWDSGQVGLGIAELLGIPSVTLAKKVEIANDLARVERVTDDGYQVVEVSLPALITVSNEIGEPRYATIMGIMEANSKPLIIWKPADIGVDLAKIGVNGRKSKLIKLYQPIQDSKCEIVEGDSPFESGIKLADKLSEALLIKEIRFTGEW